MKTSVFNNMSGVVPNLINTAENIDKLMRRYIINYDNSVEEADHVIDLLAAALNRCLCKCLTHRKYKVLVVAIGHKRRI